MDLFSMVLQHIRQDVPSFDERLSSLQRPRLDDSVKCHMNQAQCSRGDAPEWARSCDHCCHIAPHVDPQAPALQHCKQLSRAGHEQLGDCQVNGPAPQLVRCTALPRVTLGSRQAD